MSYCSSYCKEQKSKLHDIHTMLRYRDKGQNKKRSLTFCPGVKFSRWSDFDENRLKLNGLPQRFKKYIVCHA